MAGITACPRVRRRAQLFKLAIKLKCTIIFTSVRITLIYRITGRAPPRNPPREINVKIEKAARRAGRKQQQAALFRGRPGAQSKAHNYRRRDNFPGRPRGRLARRKSARLLPHADRLIQKGAQFRSLSRAAKTGKSRNLKPFASAGKRLRATSSSDLFSPLCFPGAALITGGLLEKPAAPSCTRERASKQEPAKF